MKSVLGGGSAAEEVDMHFPYGSYRKYQCEVANAIHNGLCERKHVVMEAAAGFGKTAAALAACLPVAARRKLRVVYGCRTHQQVIGVLNELQRLRVNKGINLKAVGLYGRRELCVLDRLRQTGSSTFSHACSATKKALKCPFFAFGRRRVVALSSVADDILTASATPSFVREMFQEASYCPYEGLVELLPMADVVVLTYNYLVNPFMRSLLLRRMLVDLSRTILVVDEAHNLHRLTTYGAHSRLGLRTISKSADEADKCGFSEMASELSSVQSRLLAMSFDEDEEEVIVEKALFSGIKAPQAYHVGLRLQEQKLLNDEAPISYLLALADFIGNLGENTILLLRRDGRRRRLEAVEPDPLKITKPLFSGVYGSVSMSGTLSPLEAYVDVIGLPEDTVGITVPYPFPEENLRVLVASGISTRFKERNSELYAKIFKALNDICFYSPPRGGVAAFFASHELLGSFNSFVNSFKLRLQEEKVYTEKRWMNSDEVHQMYWRFMDSASAGRALLLAVQGGRLSEGVDYLQGTLNTIVIVGVPYPRPTPRIKQQIEWCKRLFGDRGKEYAYTVPALWSALQTAGRGIRGPHDTCTVIFLDWRFKRLKRLIPRWMAQLMKPVYVERLGHAL